jgi:putative ABC transport system permease protein
MTILDSLASAASSLAANKLRSVLTTLGVIIGVASVIAMVGIAEGTKKQSLERLEALGSNLISVFPQRRRDVAAGSEAQTLKLEDVDLIRRAVPTASAVTGEVRSGVTVKYGSINERSQVTGGLPEIQQIRNVRLKEGRFFTEAEDAEVAKVCVLGFDIYDRLFGDGTSALGAIVRIDGTDFEVIGIAAFKGGGGFMNPDDMIYAPINTVINRIERRESLSSISVQAKNSKVMPYTLAQVQSTLAKVRSGADGEELFRAFNQG